MRLVSGRARHVGWPAGGPGRGLLPTAMALVLLLGGCSYALTPWYFNWTGDARCFDKGQGTDSPYRGSRLTLIVSPEDRSPGRRLGLLVDADGRASYSTGGRVTACLAFPAADLEALDRLWGDGALLADAPAACRSRLSLVDGGPLPERRTSRGPHYHPDNSEPCRLAALEMAGRAASSMRNVWIEYVGSGGKPHMDFRWDLAVPLPELYEETLMETLNLLCARSGELTVALRERLPAGLAERIDCRAAAS